VTVRFEETLGAIGLWILGRGWNWAALVDTVPALLEWYRFGLVLEIADELVRELKLNGGRS
jgi:hypothetical protein